jgi:hypothetical protein
MIDDVSPEITLSAVINSPEIVKVQSYAWCDVKQNHLVLMAVQN